MTRIDYTPARKSDNGPIPTTVRERFEKYLPVERPEGACWEWLGTIQKRIRRQGEGYGLLGARLVDGRYRMVYAHRIAWELLHGPTELYILHSCDNRRCVNPAHLFEGSQKDNIMDAVAKGRHVSGFFVRAESLGMTVKEWCVRARGIQLARVSPR
jgi:hypothetical protein